MQMLKDYERQQSGVQTILRELQEQQEDLKNLCARPQAEDPVQDAHKTQWYRSQFALISYIIDKMEEVEDTGGDEEGIGKAALPPSQQE